MEWRRGFRKWAGACACSPHPAGEQRSRRVRTGLRLLLEREPDFVVVGEATDGREAVDWLSRERADVVVMDVGMPVLSGIEATGQIIRRYQGIGVVI